MTDYDIGNRYAPVTDNRELRIGYMLNDFGEDEWKKMLQKTERDNELKEAKRQSAEMLVMAATDLFHQLIIRQGEDEIKDLMQQLENLVIYYNESVDKIAKRFKRTTAEKFNTKWERQTLKVE